MKAEEYEPIDCTLHDRIEAHASLGETVPITYREGDRILTTTDRIVDWFVSDNAEYMRTATDLIVRLDHVVSIAGVDFR